MMGRKPKVQNKLFYTAVNLEQRVRKDHILRKIKRYIDFDFIYNEVKDTYGINGNESVAPPIILKMMLLLIFYNVRSERELALTIPERLDWLWFLDYDIDDDIPNHSVLSKARARWGVEVWIFPKKVDRVKRKVSGSVFHIPPGKDTRVLSAFSAGCRRPRYIQKWNVRYPDDLHNVHDRPTRFS